MNEELRMQNEELWQARLRERPMKTQKLNQIKPRMDTDEHGLGRNEPQKGILTAWI